MITFSDLDRTIIYSNKFLDTDKEYKCIETYKDKEISYISLDTIKYIKEIQENTLFIPTTTRTVEQFQRINFQENKIVFPWAITSNGGCILKDNKILKSWSDKVEKIKANSEPIKNMVDEFKQYIKLPYVTNFKVVEELFFYIVVEKDKFNIKDLDDYIEKLDFWNWSFYISGRKIYFLPRGITKENAIDYIINELGVSDFIAIGDSNMDAGMLKMAGTSYLLKHGDAVGNNIGNHCIVTDCEGMEGTEEVLLSILERNTEKSI